MAAMEKKLERWAEKLLDTGKRNNLVSFHDTKASSAEVIAPNPAEVFSLCAVGRQFMVFDPKIQEDDLEDLLEEEESEHSRQKQERLGRDEYKERYLPHLRGKNTLLVYAQTPNPVTAVKNIAKRSAQIEDETGVNVSYLAFGFVRWRERETAQTTFRAPLLLVHVNLVTGSAIDPVRIEVTDDDVVVNPTFSFLLQAEFGLSLPAFEEDDTLPSYLERTRQLVRKLGWEVTDECKLGIFSFLKINMYVDLMEHAEQILDNPIVLALIDELPEEKASLLNAPEGIHVVDNPLIDLHTVVDADSSQIEAIEMAKSGRSFVLQGPPGTGKSQTITNIIAECLYDGKRVLFVSEKQAALNVVYGKLAGTGLADFCLELHSHKANKKAVIGELNRTLEASRYTVRPSAADEIRLKREAQEQLDAYAFALHEKRDVINRSLFELIELHAAQAAFPDLDWRLPGIESRGESYLLLAERLLEQYADFLPSIGDDWSNYPWYGFSDDTLDFDGRAALKRDLETLRDGYEALDASLDEIEGDAETARPSLVAAERLRARLSYVAATDVACPSLLCRDGLDDAMPRIQRMRKEAVRARELRDRLLQRYDAGVLDDLSGAELTSALTNRFSSFFSRLLNSEYKALVTSIASHARSHERPDHAQAVEFARELTEVQDALASFKDAASAAFGLLGTCYQGVDTDWDHVMADLGTLDSLMGGEERLLGALTDMDAGRFRAVQGDFAEGAALLDRQIGAVRKTCERLSAMFDRTVIDFEHDPLDLCVGKAQGCLGEFDGLGNWLAFSDLLGRLRHEDLEPFLRQAIDAQIRSTDIVGTFRKSFFRQWIDYLLFSVPVLASFSRARQDQTVRVFCEKDTLQYDISRAQIKERLSAMRPNLDVVAGGSPVSVLRREGQKSRKQMPIRRLMSEVGQLIQQIKPCFLMSPLSVSTFLDPNAIAFDVVVFDEASQIFPQDAIGAIYRGKQLIVVGDSRQMPPSNFFNSAADIEDDDETGDVADFESILDICSSVFATKRLCWHYRSRYEQLIAFSNVNFYRGSLVTFPSVSKDREGIGVDYHHVDGTFDRKSKTNRAEANFVVEQVFRHFQHYPERSLGVVAFSVAQQTLIDKLVTRRREELPQYEAFFASDRAEPFFVKNLETVQGDERDTIIFSVAYAPDAGGRFLHNFGPLNREGGERRLNVAITRAKHNVQLVASIRHTDIDLTRTSAEGARLLRAYLDYAANGERALERTLTVEGEDRFDSDFEMQVCDYLRSQGFTVDTQVGCSGYRIDLGLRRPEGSDYVLAIECDGATYHSSKNARDRDRLRQSVLEGMGWTFYRIWSTDWFRNTAVEKSRLLEAAMKAIENGTQRTQERPQESTGPSDVKTNATSASSFTKSVVVDEMEGQQHTFKTYEQTDALSIIRRETSFQRAVRQILEVEAPLSEDYLLRRIVSYFGKEKVTAPVRREFARMMAGCQSLGIIRRDGFLYLEGAGRIEFRVPGHRRDIGHISLEELGDGLYVLAEQNVSVTKRSLFKAMVGLLGYKRSGAAITTRLEKALGLLMTQGFLQEEDGMLHCVHGTQG